MLYCTKYHQLFKFTKLGSLAHFAHIIPGVPLGVSKNSGVYREGHVLNHFNAVINQECKKKNLGMGWGILR